MDVKKEVKDYLTKIIDTINKLDINEIETIYNLLLQCYKEGRKIYVFGNGGSAATASHLAVDLNKGVSYGLEKRFKVICLNDNIPTILAYSNDLSYDDIFLEQIKNFLEEGELVIGITGSGNSTNVIKAIEYAKQKGAITIAITGYNGGKIKNIAHYTVNANIEDMQISEDIHMVINHLLLKLLTKTIKGKTNE